MHMENRHECSVEPPNDTALRGLPSTYQLAIRVGSPRQLGTMLSIEHARQGRRPCAAHVYGLGSKGTTAWPFTNDRPSGRVAPILDGAAWRADRGIESSRLLPAASVMSSVTALTDASLDGSLRRSRQRSQTPLSPRCTPRGHLDAPWRNAS